MVGLSEVADPRAGGFSLLDLRDRVHAVIFAYEIGFVRRGFTTCDLSSSPW